MEHFACMYIALINKNYRRKKDSKADLENCSMRIYNVDKVVTFNVVPHPLHSVSYSGNLFPLCKYETHGIKKKYKLNKIRSKMWGLILKRKKAQDYEEKYH